MLLLEFFFDLFFRARSVLWLLIKHCSLQLSLELLRFFHFLFGLDLISLFVLDKLVFDLIIDIDPLSEPRQVRLCRPEAVDDLRSIDSCDTLHARGVITAHEKSHRDQVVCRQSHIELELPRRELEWTRRLREQIAVNLLTSEQ